jgi:LIM domain.
MKCIELSLIRKSDTSEFLDTLMASNECYLCGKKISDDGRKIFFYGDADGQNFLVSHANCFACSLCKVPLNSRSYFLSNKKQFLCYRHSHYDAPNRHDYLFQELKTFRRNSTEPSNRKVPAIKNGLSCKCTDKTGYWYECTYKNCLYSNCFLKWRDVKHYNVMEWKSREFQEFNIEHCEEEIYEMCFDKQKHSNYYTVDEKIGPIVLSLKHEQIKKLQYYR